MAGADHFRVAGLQPLNENPAPIEE